VKPQPHRAGNRLSATHTQSGFCCQTAKISTPHNDNRCNLQKHGNLARQYGSVNNRRRPPQPTENTIATTHKQVVPAFLTRGKKVARAFLT